MGHEVVSSAALSARVRKARRDDSGYAFVLDVDVQFFPGINILFGPSGAGKSTMLDCIAGLLRPEEGRIAIGENVLMDSARRVDLPTEKRNLAYVFQSVALFPHLSVAANVAYGLTALPVAEREKRVAEMLQRFRVEKFATRKPHELSGGERQRVALARSLATSPSALLLDEPLTALDAALKRSILEDLRAWNAAHSVPVVYVTHNQEEVEALGGRIVTLENGKVAREGS